jgi:transcriptional regulator with XRE-family HTH domain
MQKLRAAMGWSQVKFGEMVGRGRSAVDQWEDAANFCRAPEALRMCRIFNVDADFIYFGHTDGLTIQAKRWLIEKGVISPD